MTKTLVALVMTAIVLITGSASAITLEVTSGFVIAGSTPSLDPVVNLQGVDFSGPFPFQTTESGGLAPLFVGVPRFPGDDGIVGFVEFFHEPAAAPLSLFDQPFATAFTMTGHVDIALDGGFDLIGHGTLVVGPAAWDPRFVQRTYTFEAPEPSSLLLLISAAGMLAVFRRKVA